MRVETKLLVLGIMFVAGHFVLEYLDWFVWRDVLFSGGVLIAGAIILYMLPARYVNAWLRFVYWSFPLLVLALLYVELDIGESNREMWPGMLDPIYITAVYIIFAIGSLIQLLREWRKANRERYANSAQ